MIQFTNHANYMEQEKSACSVTDSRLRPEKYNKSSLFINILWECFDSGFQYPTEKQINYSAAISTRIFCLNLPYSSRSAAVTQHASALFRGCGPRCREAKEEVHSLVVPSFCLCMFPAQENTDGVG